MNEACHIYEYIKVLTVMQRVKALIRMQHATHMNEYDLTLSSTSKKRPKHLLSHVDAHFTDERTPHLCFFGTLFSRIYDIHIHMHTYTGVCMYMHICTHVYMYIHTCVYT